MRRRLAFCRLITEFNAPPIAMLSLPWMWKVGDEFMLTVRLPPVFQVLLVVVSGGADGSIGCTFGGNIGKFG